jgi:hypothetical protein
MRPKFLWIFGNAVQDITVDVDIERLSHDPGYAGNLPIRLSEQGPEVAAMLWLKTQMGSQTFAAQVELREIQTTMDGSYLLEAGRKYTLNRDIESPPSAEARGQSVFLPCENLSWGGGGLNVATFLRALTPSESVVPIKYTDNAMSRSLPLLIKKFEGIRKEIGEASSEAGDGDTLARALSNLYGNSPVQAEVITAKIARLASDYAPERSLEVYLASLPVEGALYRPVHPRFRRNLVISSFRSPSREINNKIVLRGGPSDLDDEEQSKIEGLLDAHSPDVGAILLDSIKDGPLFRAAYSMYEKVHKHNENVVAILAMTDAMAKFTPWLKARGSGGKLPPFILVLNETEADRFATMLEPRTEPFMKVDGPPDIKKFAKLALVLLSQFELGEAPRIYVTLGARGSLGVDGVGHVVYVSSFSKGGARIYDTNACGDAFCAAIALLEWGKRNGHPNIADVDWGTNMARAEEMEYFMKVATAAAYCKATNPRGRLYRADLRDLLPNNYLASVILPTVNECALMTEATRHACVDENFRLRQPTVARYHRISTDLGSLIG